MGSACFRELVDSRSPPSDEDSVGPGCLDVEDMGCCPALPRTSRTQQYSKAQLAGVRPATSRSSAHARPLKLESQIQELFRLHDLNANGVLEEEELVQLNAKVAMLHYGKDVDLQAVKDKYRLLFREKLDAQGRPVPYAIFRQYVVQVLNGLDSDPVAQEMIVEQFAAEAKSARAVFHSPSFASSSDDSFRSKISMQSMANFSAIAERHVPSPVPKECVPASPVQPAMKVYPAVPRRAAQGGA